MTTDVARQLAAAGRPLATPNKYGAQKCDCGQHASKREHRRWMELALQERLGVIRNLQEQVPFVLAPAIRLSGRQKPALRYVADFVYLRDGAVVVEDTTGTPTEAKRIKQHLMMTVHGLEVRLV